MGNVLADLMLESEAATHLVMRTAKASTTYDQVYSADAAASSLDDPQGFSRLLTAVAKYFVCKQFPLVAYEAMECLGGNGYVEDFPAARIHRQAPLNAIWRAAKCPCSRCFELSRVPLRHIHCSRILIDHGGSMHLDAHIAETRRVLRWAAEKQRLRTARQCPRFGGPPRPSCARLNFVQNASQAPERGAAKVAALFCFAPWWQ